MAARALVPRKGCDYGCLPQITSCSLGELPGELYATRSNDSLRLAAVWERLDGLTLNSFLYAAVVPCNADPSPSDCGTEASAAATQSLAGKRRLGCTEEAAPLRQGMGDALFLLK